MEWLKAALIVAGGYALFVTAVGMFCSTNTKDEARERLRIGSRIAERMLAPQRGVVRGWRNRPEAAPLKGSDLRCMTPLHDLSSEQTRAAVARGEITVTRLPRQQRTVNSGYERGAA